MFILVVLLVFLFVCLSFSQDKTIWDKDTGSVISLSYICSDLAFYMSSMFTLCLSGCLSPSLKTRLSKRDTGSVWP